MTTPLQRGYADTNDVNFVRKLSQAMQQTGGDYAKAIELVKGSGIVATVSKDKAQEIKQFLDVISKDFETLVSRVDNLEKEFAETTRKMDELIGSFNALRLKLLPIELLGGA